MKIVTKESEYRSVKDRLSYSALKDFKKSRNTFFRKYILGEKIKEEFSDSLILGNYVDCKLFSPEDFDEKFATPSVPFPTGQMGELCNEMYSVALTYRNSFGEINEPVSNILFSAFETLKKKDKFKGKDFKKVESLFKEETPDGFSAEDYYNELISNVGKIPLTADILTYGDKVIETIKSSSTVGSNILTTTSTDTLEVIDQLQVYFEIEGVPFKCMMDRVIIDHQTKTIHKYDLKVTWELEDFEYNFIKMAYYLQLGVYELGMISYIKDNRPELSSYQIKPLSFITVDPSSKSDPIVYETNATWVDHAINGKDKLKGVLQLVSEISFHLERGEWRNSKQALESNGVLQLKNLE